MKKPTLRKRILNYLEANHGVWISGDEIEKKSQSAGYKASTGSRRARELHEDTLIERKEVKGTVFYRFAGEPKKQEQIIIKEINGRMTAVQV